MANSEGEDYEKMVQETLIEEIKQKWPVDNFNISCRKKFIGKSGNKYEIDIAVEFEMFNGNILVVVECKDHSRKIERSVISDFSKRIDDINANKGLMVSTQGFQSGAVKLAKDNGIDLAIIRNYTFTPFTGDPVGYMIYTKRVFEYLDYKSMDCRDDSISSLFRDFQFQYGNAYRAENVIPYLAKEKFKSEEFRMGDMAYDIGFELVSDNNLTLVDGHDLFLILIGQLLMKSKDRITT